MTIRDEIADIVASRRGVTAKTNDADRFVADKLLAKFAVLRLLPVIADDWNESYVPFPTVGGLGDGAVHVMLDGRISFTSVGNPLTNSDEARALAAGLVSAAAESDRSTPEERMRRRNEFFRQLREEKSHE